MNSTINPLIHNIIKTLIQQLPEPTWKPIEEQDLAIIQPASKLAWQTKGGTLLTPATDSSGEPRLLLSSPNTTAIAAWPDADEDLKIALFNLIIGFDDLA